VALLSAAVLVAVIVAAAAAIAAARPPQAPASLMLPKNQVTHVSDHVWAIVGFPNIGIVVGDRATLVVDTGLGPRNGAIALHEAQKLAKGPVLYLTTTHYHAEHAAGEGAFPPNTILVRPVAQQQELEDKGAAFAAMFSSRSAQMKELLAGVTFRAPDITFEKELRLDLGGVTARLFWLGQAHTKGDELVDVQPDRTLIEQDFQFFTELQHRALELKKQGKSADEAGQGLLAEFKTKFPDWPNLTAVPNVVKHVYAENP